LLSRLQGWRTPLQCTLLIYSHCSSLLKLHSSLYINDYNLDSDNAKTRGMVNLVNRVNTANPGTIDGLGTQGHLQANGAGGLKAALTLLASATGAKEVAITELDIINASGNDYTTAVRACMEVPKCVGVTVWGVSDAVSSSTVRGVND
jgi:endo-1,4-beta-xylanase